MPLGRPDKFPHFLTSLGLLGKPTYSEGGTTTTSHRDGAVVVVVPIPSRAVPKVHFHVEGCAHWWVSSTGPELAVNFKNSREWLILKKALFFKALNADKSNLKRRRRHRFLALIVRTRSVPGGVFEGVRDRDDKVEMHQNLFGPQCCSPRKSADLTQ